MNLLETAIYSAGFASAMFVLHILICNLGRGNGFIKGFLIGVGGAIAYLVATLKYSTFSLLGFYLLVSLWLFYLMVFINVLNSVTLKMLSAIYKSPNASLATGDFETIFNSVEGLESRIQMMTSSGMILREGAHWSLTRKAKWIISGVRLVKKLLNIG